MPFDKPNNGGGGYASELIEDGAYIVKCVGIEDAEPGQYGARMRWIMNLQDEATQEVIRTEDGEVYNWWVFTSTKMGEKATARKYAEAFLGRAVTPDDDPQDIADGCVEQKARALIAANEGGYPTITSIKPFTAKAGKKGAPARQPVAAAVAEDDDGEDEPF